jgi:hypothetical protein
VTVRHLLLASGRIRRVTQIAWAAWGEGEPGGDGDGFERAAFLADVAPVALPGQHRDLPPGQVLKLGMQARLFFFTMKM